MIKYNVRARQLIDVVNEIKSDRIILSPYFQRNFVWRELHKIDFIKTIMMGLPIPEIFIAKGDMDVNAMTTTSCVVDGQQRLGSVLGFIDGDFKVEEKYWSDLTTDEKENFLKYEIAIIELDINHNDPLIQEIFKRLNRTYYSLSNIEELSSEFAPAEIMLIAKLLVKELEIDYEDENGLEYHPNFPKEFLGWAKLRDVTEINDLLVTSPIFSSYEIARQVHLMFSLNILGTILTGFYNRNINREILNSYSNEVPEKEKIVKKLNEIAKKILQLNLDEKSYWFNKANTFSLILAMYEKFDEVIQMDDSDLKNRLVSFENNIPNEYKIAAKEGVNNKKERLLRNDFVLELLK